MYKNAKIDKKNVLKNTLFILWNDELLTICFSIFMSHFSTKSFELSKGHEN